MGLTATSGSGRNRARTVASSARWARSASTSPPMAAAALSAHCIAVEFSASSGAQRVPSHDTHPSPMTARRSSRASSARRWAFPGVGWVQRHAASEVEADESVRSSGERVQVAGSFGHAAIACSDGAARWIERATFAASSARTTLSHVGGFPGETTPEVPLDLDGGRAVAQRVQDRGWRAPRGAAHADGFGVAREGQRPEEPQLVSVASPADAAVAYGDGAEVIYDRSPSGVRESGVRDRHALFDGHATTAGVSALASCAT